ncbi:MAG: hypothetical protein KGL39_43715 [Patescibacteria group bacterium]|nr:hypothetical protein [Patescibacteria group bacterium]
MELREVEQETREQDDRSEDIAREVEDHKRDMDQLEQAVGALREAQASVDSEGLQSALREADQARQAAEQRLDELREQREEMMRRNDEIADQCHRSLDRKREAMRRLPLLREGQRAGVPGANAALTFYEKMESAMTEDMQRTESALEEVGAVRGRLEALDI